MDSKVQNWKDGLKQIYESLKDAKSVDLSKMDELERQMMSISDYLISNHKDLAIDDLKKEQIEFRNDTDDIFQESYFIKRLRNWPRGYPGDYETLERFYHGTPVKSEGVGLYLDNHIVTRTLAKGVRERKRVLSNILVSELEQRAPKQKILNIACGSSREIFDIGKKINNYDPRITFIDYDENAVNYSKTLIFNEGINVEHYEFMKYNALKLVSQEAIESTFGKRDIIYSAGLFDYIKTDHLKKMLSSLFHSLEPNGVLIAPFKDMKNYGIFDYHWLVDWSYFLQRTIDEVKDILVESTNSEVEIIKTESPAINFFLIRKK